MPRRDDRVSLRQILHHAREAVEMVAGRSRDDLDQDRMLNLALVRLVEVMGEAARRLSEATRLAHPQIPFAEIIGTRDRLIHG